MTASRLAWLDVTRWVALMAMFVAHAAPPAGPLDPVLTLGDYLAVALFATTMGAGAQLGADAYDPRRDGRRCAGWLAAALVRGALLVLLGVLTEQLGAQIVGVLFHLGALAIISALVVLLPTPWLVGVGVAAFASAPWLKSELGSAMTRAAVEGHDLLVRVLDVLGGGMFYRLPTLVVWACLGALVVRWWRSGRYAPARSGVVAAAALVVSAGLLAAHRAGVADIPPYSGNHPQIVLCGLLSVGVLAAALVLIRDGSPWAAPLAIAGSFTLTLYVAQHAFLGWWVRDGASDDSWITLLVLTIGGTLVAVLWRQLPLPLVLRRGPLDGPVGWISNQVRDGVTGADREATAQRTTRRRERG